MSRGACIILGICLVVLPVGFAVLMWFNTGPQGMRGTIILTSIPVAFCLIGALACLFPSTRPITLRLIGGTVFLGCLAYLVAIMLLDGPLLGNSPSEGSLVNSIVALTVIGLPAGYVAITGRYPHWGRHAAFFGAGNPRDPLTASDTSVTEP